MTRSEWKELVGRQVLVAQQDDKGRESGTALKADVIDVIMEGSWVHLEPERGPGGWFRSDIVRVIYVFPESDRVSQA